MFIFCCAVESIIIVCDWPNGSITCMAWQYKDDFADVDDAGLDKGGLGKNNADIGERSLCRSWEVWSFVSSTMLSYEFLSLSHQFGKVIGSICCEVV